MISLCVPTRGRPDRFQQMMESARRTAAGTIEIVAYRDDDDDPAAYPKADRGLVYGSGPRPTANGRVQMSGLWTKAWELASGDIAMLCGDDVIFETDGWDRRVEDAVGSVADRLVMVYTNDQTQRQAPVMPFVSREWIKAAGFTPPYFQGWFADEWIWAIAAEIGRVIFLDDVIIHHYQLGGDATYNAGMFARQQVGGIDQMRIRHYGAPMVFERDGLAAKLRARMDSQVHLEPTPRPVWYAQSLEWNQAAREHRMREEKETLVVVHCYAGDKDVVKDHMPLYQQHGAKVLVLSPEDAPVKLRGVECRSAGEAAYFGQKSLDRQRAHLEMLLEEYPFEYYLLHDADSVCMSRDIPRYLYLMATDTVWANIAHDWRTHPSPYPKIALHPPYFLTRQTLERLLSVADLPQVKAHPITPYIDWYMLALTCEAGLSHRGFPDGDSFPAWKHGWIPETQQLGHDFKHEYEEDGFFPGDEIMARRVREGSVMIHSVKHKRVLDQLIVAHQKWVDSGEPCRPREYNPWDSFKRNDPGTPLVREFQGITEHVQVGDNPDLTVREELF